MFIHSKNILKCDRLILFCFVTSLRPLPVTHIQPVIAIFSPNLRNINTRLYQGHFHRNQFNPLCTTYIYVCLISVYLYRRRFKLRGRNEV